MDEKQSIIFCLPSISEWQRARQQRAQEANTESEKCSLHTKKVQEMSIQAQISIQMKREKTLKARHHSPYNDMHKPCGSLLVSEFDRNVSTKVIRALFENT